MGQNLPDRDVERCIETIEPDSILTFFVDPAVVSKAAHSIEKFSSFDPNLQILVAVRSSPEIDALKKENVHFLHGMKDLDNYL